VAVSRPVLPPRSQRSQRLEPLSPPMGWGSGALQVGLLPPLVIDRGDTYGASGSPKRPPGGLHRCPPSVSGPRKGRRRIPTVPVGYTIVYNRRWPKPLAGMQKVSSSDQKRARSVKTGSSFVLPILPNDPKNRIGASAKGVFGPSRREKRPFLPSGIYYSVAQLFCTKGYKLRPVHLRFPVPRSRFPGLPARPKGGFPAFTGWSQT
jgi:hypothetical protein